MKSNGNMDIYHRELNTILKFSALLNSSLKIEDVLNHAMKWAEEFIRAEASSIYELNEAGDEMFVRIARGEKKAPIKKIRLKIGEGVAGWVVKTGRPMVVHDVEKEKRFSNKYDILTGFHTRSLICVPLILRGKTIGAIQVLNKKTPEPFSGADLEILTSLSQQIVVAMENAKLYQRLEKKFELTARELKITEEKLLRSERLAAVGHIVDGVAHEIRNPITIIGGLSRRIKTLSKNRNIAKYTDIILSETARLERIVKKVGEFAMLQSAAIRPEHLEPVIEEALSRFKHQAEKQGVKIKVEIISDLPVIGLDTSQMVTALSNIIENSMEAISGSGEIELKISPGENSTVLIIIRDSGSGIAPDKLDSVYDPFVTSKTSGAGLGLTMVNQIVLNHHGEMNIDSDGKKGTTVTIRLPINHDETFQEKRR